MLDKIRIVLVGPQHGGNIGSSARALKNMGLKQLFLVNPLEDHTSANAQTMAAGAGDLLAQAKVVSSIEAAVHNCSLIWASSSRTPSFSWQTQMLRQASINVATQLSQSPAQDIAILFGRERTGLTTAELQLADFQLEIPADNKYPVINLAQAVQLVCYELRLACEKPQPTASTNSDDFLASFAEKESMYQHIEAFATGIGFLNPNCPKNLMPRIRRLFNKAKLEKKEINILRGILNAAEN